MISSEPNLLVLHALRLVGVVDAPTVATRVDLDRGLVDRILADAAADGVARRREGARPGWSLTDEGRKENERLLAVELDQAGLREPLGELYGRFRPINRRLLEVCTDWQVVDRVAGRLNDHSDPGYDRLVIDRLGGIDRQVQPLCATLGAWFERFGTYGPRLALARERVEAGEHDWFDRPTLDSYHTVWFELHEDLLATLGLDRASEPVDPYDNGDPAGGPHRATGAERTPERT